MGSKKLQVWLPLVFSLVMVVGMWIGFKLRDSSGGVSSFSNNSKKNSLQEIIDLVNNKYVDAVSGDSISNLAIDNLLAHLDPHSVYIPAAELQTVNEDLQGNFQGIGVEFQIFSDTVNVMNVIDQGPSFKAGVEVGDKILSVNDTTSIAGKKMKADDIRKWLRGPAGTNVKIKVLRNHQEKNIIIQRGTIPIPSVDVSYLVAPGIGFLRINKFGETTYQEFMFALEKLQQQGMTKLILDLRGNGGGLLNEAADIADEFLEDNKLIVYTKGNKSPRYEYKCKRDGLFEKGKLVVLVDEMSASASEILSGALQDWDRATIIGRRTFGKGLVQQQFQLTDGGALRLTIARYYTPIGRNIQKPYNKGKEAYDDELMARYHDGEMEIGDTSKPVGPSFKTPKGHLVYGGGGITPDIFIPYDTSVQTKPILQLYYKGILNTFAYNYYIQHKDLLQHIKSPSQLSNAIVLDEKEWSAFSSFAAKDSIDLQSLNAKAKTDLLKKISAYLAKQIWRTEGYFEITNLSDPMIKKSLDILK